MPANSLEDMTVYRRIYKLDELLRQDSACLSSAVVEHFTSCNSLQNVFSQTEILLLGFNPSHPMRF